MPRKTPTLIAALVVMLALAGHAWAQSSLGIGANEAGPPSTGLSGNFLNWVNTQQTAFYHSLSNSLKAMRQDSGQVWWLIGMSFAYGVFHAAGPGHGKVVISSYMLANEVELRRGVMLSFVSAFLQAVTAIVIVAAIYVALSGVISMTKATWFLEIASYALLTLFGLWLLWRKTAPRLGGLTTRLFSGGMSFKPSQKLQMAAAGADMQTTAAPAGSARLINASCGCDQPVGRFQASAADAVCDACGHSHMPDPNLIGGDKFDWRTALTAIAAVGMRPCSGALIVLSFAFLNGLYAGGVLSVLAMSIGTAITVSLLATLAVTAKNWALATVGKGNGRSRLHAAIEIGGATLVFLLGLTMLAASLQGANFGS